MAWEQGQHELSTKEENKASDGEMGVFKMRETRFA